MNRKNMHSVRQDLLPRACAFAASAAAEYPDRPIRLIVPQAPGGATDTVARILAAEMGKEISRQIIVDNRPGGASIKKDSTKRADVVKRSGAR
jgi:tripartite-type tricarboxylate transporter receptor subunit TctC